MFGTIRKHQTWLWAIIITVIIISFVWFFSPYTKMRDTGGRSVNFGSIYGRKITEENFIHAQREAILNYFFMTGGHWPDEDRRQTGFDLEREAFHWLLLVRKAEQLGLDVSRETAAEFARDLLGGFKSANINSAQAFEQQVLEPRRMDQSDFERFVRDYIAIQEVIATASVPGKLVTPQEARGVYIRNHQELSTEAVFFSASNYLASVPVSPEAINSYYTNHLAEYRIPERIQVKYVVFPVSNFLATAEAELAKTNLNELVDMNLERLGTNYVRFGKTPDEAKAKIREELIRDRALLKARQQAGEFARELFNKEPARAENLDALAKEKGLEVKVSAPFDVRGTPAGLDVGQDFTRIAFSRSADEPFAPPITGRDGVYVITMDRRLPSEVPSLDSIRARVVNEYKMTEATKLARNAGERFSLTASNALAQGKSFADVCRDANVTPVTLPAFSMSSQSIPGLAEDFSADEVKQAAFSTEPGKVSKLQETSNGGLMVYVKSKLPVDEAKLNADLPKFLVQLRRSRQNEAFTEWFQREVSTSLRDTLYQRSQQPPPKMGAAPSARKS